MKIYVKPCSLKPLLSQAEGLYGLNDQNAAAAAAAAPAGGSGGKQTGLTRKQSKMASDFARILL